MKNRYQTFSLSAIMCCLMFTCLAAPNAAAGDDIWTGTGDGISFDDPVNWSLGVVPGVLDNAIFDSRGGPITFAADQGTAGLFVRNATVSFGLGNTTYQVSDLLRIGELSGDRADLELVRGTVHVLDTNFDDFVLGFEGDGTMFIRRTAALVVDGQVLIGDAGNGDLTIRGAATMGRCFVADDAGSFSDVLVSGAVASWDVATTLKIGNGGDGEVNVLSAASLTAGTLLVGHDVASDGRLNVLDAGSTLDIAGTTKIGNRSVGSLVVANGAAATIGGNLIIGDDPAATGSCTVSGAGSSLLAGAFMFVGNFGTGDLTVDAGATLSSSRVKVGDEVGSSGTITVSGPGSDWTDTVEVIVGNFGAGQLNISGGGSASSVITTLGDDPGSNGAVTVDGAGSSWVSSARLRVGNFGSGSLTIRNGGAVSASRVQLGFGINSSGDVTVDSAGSTLSAGTNFRNGLSGTGSLTIIGGAQVDAGGGYVQQASGSLHAVLNANTVTMISAQTANLAGGLTVTLAPGFSPPPGTEFTLVSAPVVNGVFASVSLPPNFEIIYAADSVRVRAGEPSGTPATLTDLTIIDGFLASGGLPELASSDDTYFSTLALETGKASETHRLLYQVGATTTVQNPTSLDITLEGHILDLNVIGTLFLMNANTGLFEQVGQFTQAFGTDTTNTVNVPNASRFVDANGRIVLHVKKVVILPLTVGEGFPSRDDFLEIRVQ